MKETDTMRLLPWTGPEGKPCYVVGDGTGYLSRVADDVESVQLGMADGLLDHAAAILAEPVLTHRELRFLSDRLAESLRDVCRVAQSRGVRLSALVDGDSLPESGR